MSNRPTNAQREEVFKRAKGLCEYCQSQEKYSNSTISIHKIIAESHLLKYYKHSIIA